MKPLFTFLLSLILSTVLCPAQSARRHALLAKKAVAAAGGLAMNQVTSCTLSNWYDTSDASTIFFDGDRTILQTTNGAAVGGVSDKGPGGVNLRYFAFDGLFYEYAPNLVTSAQNGKNGLIFTNTNSRLFSADIPASGQPFTLVLVFRATDLSGGTKTLLGQVGGNAYAVNLTSTPQYRFGDPTLAFIDFGTPDTSFHVLIAVFNGASSKWSLDGSAFTTPGTDLGTTSPQSFSIGCYTGNSQFFRGYILELGFFVGTISDADAAGLFTGLDTKW